MPALAHVAAALSEHPLLTHAVGECVGQLIEQAGTGPDLLVLCVTEAVAGALEDVHGATRRLLDPTVLVGCTTEGIAGGALQVDGRAAVSMFGVWLDGAASDAVRPVHLDVERGADGDRWAEPLELAGAHGTLALFADGAGPSLDPLVARLSELAPDLVVVGGAVGGARLTGGSRLLLDGAVHRSGAAAVLLGDGVPVGATVSQGYRPFGPTFTVTRSERNVVRELGGRPALERLMDAVEELSTEDRALAAGSVHLGWAVADVEEPGPGDVLVRHVLGADRSIGALAVGAPVEVGVAARFHLFDAASAHDDLAHLGARVAGARGVFAFLGSARGARLFGTADHDAATLSDLLDGAALAGSTCEAVVGPVGRVGAVHRRGVAALTVG